MNVLARVRRFVERHALANDRTRVMLAVSGGSDSVALAHLFRELADAGECRVVGVAHFNHLLRATAGRDEQLTTALADALGWPITVGREDVAARARRERLSIETAARAARHAFLEQARVARGADVIALGHTRDDQAETFLLRLIRGAGPTGLAAMHPRHGALVRPLLPVRRRELREYLAARHIGYVEDETNADVTIPRNRVRAELLPLLESRFNPGIVDVLADEADLARETWQWMEEESRTLETAARAVQPAVGPDWPDTEGLTSAFEVEALEAMPPALRRLMIWKAMRTAARGRPISFVHVDAALELLRSKSEVSVDLPGHTVERLPGRLVLTSRAPNIRSLRQGPANFFDYPLSIPGEVSRPHEGWALAAQLGGENGDPGGSDPSVKTAAVHGDLGSGQWRVRNRRRGDRFRPVGVGGWKKLQDYFVDRKVPRHKRDAVPLVVDGRDRIVWVAGFGIDEAFRVNDPAQAVIILRLKLLGGSA